MSFHLYVIDEVYSNADGSVQYVELFTSSGGQNLWSGHDLTATQGATTHSYTFPGNLPSSSTAGTHVLIATQGFADLGLVTPDYIVPTVDGGFLFNTGASSRIDFAGVDHVDYTTLPGGILSINHSGTSATNSPENFSGSTGSIPGNPVVGTSGNNNLSGTAAVDFMVALAGNDILDGAAGADTLKGGTGDDVYFVDNSGDTVIESSSAGTDVVQAGLSWVLGDNLENLMLTGAGAINGTGNALANLIVGNTGVNVLNGSSGNDTMNGGNGSDSYNVDSAADVVTESNAVLATGGTDIVNSTATSFTLGANVENLRILSAGAANGTGNSLNNVLYAGAGNNVLNGGAGIDTVSYAFAGSAVSVSLASAVAQPTGGSGSDTLSLVENLTGSNFADHLTGNPSANTLAGGAGNDTLTGGSGNDTLNGGTGNDAQSGGDGSDTYYVDSGSDTVVETNATLATGGSDTVYSSLGSYTLGANVENLRILATGVANGTGNALNNVLYAGAGNNVLNGGAGSDTISYGFATAAVTVSLASVVAQPTGGSGSDTLSNLENLTGSNFNDTLTGGTGNNILSGGAGNDTLNGGAGNDKLVGGAGNDRLTGGAGADAFVFSAELSATTNKDTLTDFTIVTDKLHLDDDIFKAFTAGTAVTVDQFYSAAGAVAAHDASDRIIYNTSTGALYYDADGNAAGSGPVQFAVLGTTAPHPAISQSDFIVVA